MRFILPRCALFLFALGVTTQAGLVTCQDAFAAHPQRRSVQGDIFYNHYAYDHQTNQGVPAQLYMSPVPTPPIVGHTYFTYQPLMPHEYMYGHHRDYWRATPDGSWSHTSVKYMTGPRWYPTMSFFRR